ncbi:hypothetical protein [Microbulbifer spongiae]|uniref:GNAT family N-acetyltransferase n=1 Tax=Microbulbifer spongiae TaxID=2944933 RepID=A0ABY9EGI7_9GAMM|nr:hypothetical protein [Microbulbifer sp. MI-G]WKD50525.1 hypothetical protein M8T91_03590 [Microbulbifer sp. MI-G]
MKATHRSAEERYEHYRELARRSAAEAIPMELKNQIRFDKIRFQALVQAKSWEGSPLRKVDWNWSREYELYSFTNPKRFELSIWHRHQLCALSLGRPTWSGARLRLDSLEAAPHNHPLRSKVLALTLLALEEYAEQIGAHEIRIMEPVNEKVRDYYSSKGFTYNPRGDYCWRSIV